MIGKLLFLLLLIYVAAIDLNAQGKSKLVDCRKVAVKDPDRRSFDELNSFVLDVNGDHKPDTITPRTYRVKIDRKISGKNKPREIHWIAFDLKTGMERVVKSFFKYNYGNDLSDYWVYAFIPCRFNRDGKTDFVFYSGDDTSDETIILVNRGNRFEIYSRKIDDYNE